VVLAAIIGAKLLLIINDFSFYASNPRQIFSLSMVQAGGVFYGGVIAAIATAIYYVRKHHMPALRTCDTFAPGLALGHSIGRIGCFAAGCCYANSISGTPLYRRIEPTQLFESAIEFINFLILYALLRHKKFEGQVIGAYLFLYGVARFFIEFIRDDPDRGSMFNGALTGTQFISILLVIAGGILWWMRREPRPKLVAAVQR